MHRYRKLLLFLGLFLVVAAIAAALTYHWIRRPVKAVLLLPNGNLMLYVNFTPFHSLDLGQKSLATAPQYQDFVEQTGFHFEHDLDDVTVSQVNPGDLNEEVSAILTGTFDQERLNRYLQKQPVATESYAGKTVFSIQEGRQTVRVCILDGKTVGMATGASAESIHSMIDKSNSSGQTPTLLRDYYGDVPFGSVAWAIARVPADPGRRSMGGGMNLDFLQDSVMIVSARYIGSLRLRVEFISATQTGATHAFQAVNGLVALARAAGESGSKHDQDLSALIDSLQVQQNGNRVILSAEVPQDVLKKIAESH